MPADRSGALPARPGGQPPPLAMADSNVRSNPVNVEQIMEQIRSRIREQRGVEYTEQQIQDLAVAQLEKYLDPKKVRSNLLEEFRRLRASSFAGEPPREATDDAAVFRDDRAWVRAFRSLLRPITRLLINTRALATVLMQSEAEKSRRTRDQVLFELIHNLTVETTRLGIEVKNLKMRNESLAGRVEFNERRARALEGAVMYQPSRGESAPERLPSGSQMTGTSPATTTSSSEGSQDRPPQFNAAPGAPGEGSGRRRRRRRRGRRGGGQPFVAGSTPSSSPGTTDRPDNPGPEMMSAESPASETHGDDDDHPESDHGESDAEPQ
jgi:hypothetical protein